MRKSHLASWSRWCMSLSLCRYSSVSKSFVLLNIPNPWGLFGRIWKDTSFSLKRIQFCVFVSIREESQIYQRPTAASRSASIKLFVVFKSFKDSHRMKAQRGHDGSHLILAQSETWLPSSWMIEKKISQSPMFLCVPQIVNRLWSIYRVLYKDLLTYLLHGAESFLSSWLACS